MSATTIDEINADEPAFVRNMITGMAVVLLAGFLVQYLMGRSSFASPLIVHVHAVVFMVWVAITLAQAWLAASGSRALHRNLGAFAFVWVCAMGIAAPLATVNAVRMGRVPFFFQPQHFLIADPASVIGFLVLFGAAVALRRRPDWHGRLQVGAFMMLMGPGLGRLLPMPLLAPYAFEAAGVTSLVVAGIGATRDMRVNGKIHPAWGWSVGILLVSLIAARLIGLSPVGDEIYASAISGSNAPADGRAFPAPPPAP
jgi:hypothetical protein